MSQVFAHDPKVTLDGSTPFFIGIDKLDRRLVALDVPAAEQLCQHQLVDRFGPIRGNPHPLDHRLAAEFGTPLGRHRLEPIQRTMPGDGLCRASAAGAVTVTARHAA